METPSVAPITRKILIKSSQGEDGKVIEFSGTTKKELVEVLVKAGYNARSMKIIESITRRSLEHDSALVPTVDHRIHLYPIKTKGGAKKAAKVIRSRSELYGVVKEAFARNKDAAEKHFNKDKNFTRKGSEELEVLATKWEKKYGVNTGGNEMILPPAESTGIHVSKPAKEKKTRSKDKAVTDLVDSLAENAPKEEAKELTQEELIPRTPEMTIKTAISLLQTISGHENQVVIEEAITKLGKALILKPSLSELEIANMEHDELFNGLSDVNR